MRGERLAKGKEERLGTEKKGHVWVCYMHAVSARERLVRDGLVQAGPVQGEGWAEFLRLLLFGVFKSTTKWASGLD